MRLGFSLILLLWSSGCGSYKPQDLIIGVWVVNVANSVQMYWEFGKDGSTQLETLGIKQQGHSRFTSPNEMEWQLDGRANGQIQGRRKRELPRTDG